MALDAALCAVALQLLAADGTTWAVTSVTSEARSYTRTDPLATNTVSELEIDPQVSIQNEQRALGFSGSYLPRIWGTTLSQRVQFLHRASLAADFRLDPTWRIRTSADGSYGVKDLLAQSPTKADALQTIGAEPRVQYGFGQVQGGIDADPGPRAHFTATAAYVVDGGTDAAARRTLPLQRGPRLAGSFDWKVTPFDSLGTLVNASWRSFSTSAVDLATCPAGATDTSACGRLVIPSVLLATATETWTRKVGQELQTILGAGASTSGVGGVHAVGDAAVQYAAQSGDLEARLAGHYGQVVDGTTGKLYDRTDGLLALGWVPARVLRIGIDVSSGRSIAGAQVGLGVTTGELRAVWSLSESVAVTAGVRGLWQTAARDGTGIPYRQWGIYLAAGARRRDGI